MSNSKDKIPKMKNLLETGKAMRIVGLSGRVYVGTVIAVYDDCLIFEDITGEIIIILYDSIESLWEGLNKPEENKEGDGN